MTNEEYHARPEISKSGLDKIHKSPAHYKYALENPPEQTPSMLFGSLVHSVVFGQDDYYIMPDINKRTNAGKAEYESHLSEFEQSDKEFLVTQTQVDEAIKIRDAVLSHPMASVLIREGCAEKPIFSELLGVQVKCKPDWVNTKYNVVIDLKTTTDASPKEFSKSCYNHRYHVQAAFYLDVLRAAGKETKGFVFIAVEKEPPYAVAIYELGENELRLGRLEYITDLETYKKCAEENIYPCYSEKIIKLNLPSWAFNI